MISEMEETKHFDDEWFYGELSLLDLENTLDLRDWYGQQIGPRWRGMREDVWSRRQPRPEWRKLLRRLPHYFAAQVTYLNSKLLDIACRLLPHFDSILADHAYYEWLLYAEFDYENYRDHIVHPFKTAVIANWLLRETGKMSMVRDCLRGAHHVKRLLAHWGLHEDVLSEDECRIITVALWLASLLHDLGYGHYFACQLHRRLVQSYHFCSDDIVGRSVAGVKSELIERSLILRHLVDQKAWEDHLDYNRVANLGSPRPTEKWRVTLFENLSCNHSIAGGVNLLCLLQEIIDYWPKVNPRLALIFELAAESVLLHDLTSQSNFLGPSSRPDAGGNWPLDNRRARISFEDSPLAVILILADELQCWGRPRLIFRHGADENETIVKYHSPIQRLRYRRIDREGSMVTLEVEEAVMKQLNKLTNPADSLPSVNWDRFILIRTLV